MRRATMWLVAALVAASAVPADRARTRPRYDRGRKSFGGGSESALRSASGRISGSTMRRCSGCGRRWARMRAGGVRWSDGKARSERPRRAAPARGSPPSPDSVARLTDELMALRVRYAESFRQEQAELATYLDPVQRARLTLLRDRLVNRARDFRGPSAGAANGSLTPTAVHFGVPRQGLAMRRLLLMTLALLTPVPRPHRRNPRWSTACRSPAWSRTAWRPTLLAASGRLRPPARRRSIWTSTRPVAASTPPSASSTRSERRRFRSTPS